MQVTLEGPVTNPFDRHEWSGRVKVTCLVDIENAKVVLPKLVEDLHTQIDKAMLLTVPLRRD